MRTKTDLTNTEDPLRKKYLILCPAGLVLIAISSYLAFFYAPNVPSMGISQRIFYIHVPAAWVSYIGFLISFAASIKYLIRPTEKAAQIARAGGEIGLLFGLVILTTGPIWARVAWGVWWSSEPKLLSMTFMVLMFSIYCTLLFFNDQPAVRKLAALIALFATPNVFFVHYAFKRYQGIHPQGVISGGLNSDMRIALYMMFFAELLIFLCLFFLRLDLLKEKLALKKLKENLNALQNEVE